MAHLKQTLNRRYFLTTHLLQFYENYQQSKIKKSIFGKLKLNLIFDYFIFDKNDIFPFR